MSDDGLKITFNGKVPDVKSGLKSVNNTLGRFEEPAAKVNWLYFGLGALGTTLFLKLLNGLIELLNTFNYGVNVIANQRILGLSILTGVAMFYLPVIVGKLEIITGLRKGQKWFEVVKFAEKHL